MSKSTLNQHIEQSRKAQCPKVGDRVEYPVPHTLVSHVERKGKTHEVAGAVGHEEWFAATVTAVEHHEYTESPDDYVAVLEPDEGMALSLSVVFLRPA